MLITDNVYDVKRQLQFERKRCNLSVSKLSCHIERESIMLFAAKEKGQGLVEYAIILSFVFVVVIVVVKEMGPMLGDTYSTINNSIP